MDQRFKGRAALVAGCGAIFWPGAFIFSFPGLMGSHWQETFQVGSAAVGQTLFIVLATIGVFMFLVGRWQEKIGPPILAAIGAVCCGGGTLLLSYASSIVFVYAWAFMMGLSSSCILIPTLTVAQRWYPQRRGLVSGLVNLVFGLSAAFISPIYVQLLNFLTYNQMAIMLGLIALIFGLAVAPLVRFPGTAVPHESKGLQTTAAPDGDLTVAQSLQTATFWLLWLTWAFSGAAGVAMIPLSTSFGLSKGLSAGQAVLILTAFNLTNGLSRLASGYLSDIIGRNVTMGLAFLAAGCAYFLMPHLEGLVMWCLLAATIGYAFGTLFSVSAPLASDCFGLTHFGAIYGLVFTAYGFIAGPLGPWLSGLILDATGGNFKLVFSYLGSLCVLSTIFIWFTRPPATASTI